MSLAKRINLVKNKYKDIDKVYNATISAEYDDSRGDFIGNLRLYINTPFKMAKIFYSGDVEILDTTYEGMSITNKDGVIYVMNYNKVSLSDDLLLQFLREIKITKVKIYSWGANSVVASIDRTQSELVKDNDDVFGTTGLKFDEYIPPKQERLIVDEPKPSTGNNIISNLYTEGERLHYKGTLYKGYYHYHKNTKQYMTGKTHDDDSKVLGRFPKRRRKNGL